MATVIDALVVTLGLDSSSFRKGQADVNKSLDNTRKSADRTARDMQDSGRRASEFFSSLTGSALKFFAVLSAGRGLADFTRNTIAGGAELSRLSRNLGMSAATISQWGNAVEVAGGDAAAFRGTLAGLSQSLTAAKLGDYGSPLAQGLIRFNVALSDSEGKARNLDAILLDLSDKLRGVPNRADAYNIAAQMGLDDGTINLLLRGRQEVAKMLDNQRRGVALTEQQARAAEAAAEKWTKVKQQLEANGRELLYKLLPALEKGAELFIKLADVAVPALVQIADLVSQADVATDGWSTKIIAAIALFRVLGGAAIVGGIISLGNAILGIGTAAGTAANGAGMAALLSKVGMLTRIGGPLAMLTYSESLGSPESDAFEASLARKHGTSLPPGAKINGDGTVTMPSSASKTSVRSSKPGGTPESRAMFSQLESKYGLPAGLLDAVWAQESGRGKNMRSPVGAMGHFQFMPATAKQYGLENQDDLGQSADAAGRMFRDLLKKYNGELPKALAAYNWGSGNVDRRGLAGAMQIPETANYIRSIMPMVKGTGAQAMPAPSASASAQARAAIGAAPTAAQTNITTGPITVNTQATDARGVARDLRAELVSQANTGMQ